MIYFITRWNLLDSVNIVGACCINNVMMFTRKRLWNNPEQVI